MMALGSFAWWRRVVVTTRADLHGFAVSLVALLRLPWHLKPVSASGPTRRRKTRLRDGSLHHSTICASRSRRSWPKSSCSLLPQRLSRVVAFSRVADFAVRLVLRWRQGIGGERSEDSVPQVVFASP